jgi:hypothetical protein
MGKMTEGRKIIFVDSLTSINEVKNFFDKENVKIITFDYSSHVELTEKNIEHEISEVYLMEDIDKLQRQCYEFLNWYDLDIIKKNINFFNVNIPKLYNDQLIHPIVKILKKFSEIKVIIKKFPNLEYFASGDLFLISKLLIRSIF